MCKQNNIRNNLNPQKKFFKVTFRNFLKSTYEIIIQWAKKILNLQSTKFYSSLICHKIN